MSGRRTLHIALAAAGTFFCVLLAVAIVMSCLELVFPDGAAEAEALPAEEAALGAVSAHGGVVSRFQGQPNGPVRWVSFRTTTSFGDKELGEVIPHLAPLQQLRALILSNTNVTDAGLKELACL